MNTQISDQKTIRSELEKELGIGNIMAVPRLLRIVINCGLGEALADKKALDAMSAQLAAITGQKPQVTRAKRAISTFKLRAGDAIGLKVTLRGKRMYDFLVKFIGIALPRVRDFHGVPLHGFDHQGNYTMGVTEQTIFPELEFSMVDKVRGFEVTFVTSAADDPSARALLTKLGMPFEKEK
ncbi:50S ribosomal protein L5 [Patescibacteria group bacterium]|nr:50S ribosomal protein L5 [Patescibacteria group bacterium]